jgi:hypothetical protein
MNSLGVQPNEMSAVLAILTTEARFDTEQVRVGAVNAFSQGHTNLWDDYVAGAADCKQILARNVSGAALEVAGLLAETEDPATHEDMRMGVVIGFNVLKTLIHPVDAVFAVDHKNQRSEIIGETSETRSQKSRLLTSDSCQLTAAVQAKVLD